MNNQANTTKSVKFSKSSPTVYTESKQSQTSKNAQPPARPKETKKSK